MASKYSNGMAILAFAATAAMGASAFAETITFKSTLKGADEVPATTSAATGAGEFTYDNATKKLSYKITHTGLSGPATAAHIHGPAEAGKNAGVAVPFEKAASPIEGSATLTDAQAADLVAGKMYVNVHTDANKSGEIRGQITK